MENREKAENHENAENEIHEMQSNQNPQNVTKGKIVKNEICESLNENHKKLKQVCFWIKCC